MAARTRFQVILPIGYTVLFLASVVVFLVYPSNDGLSGVFAVLLTLPWCLIMAALRLTSDLTAIIAAMIVCAALNACCLYVLGTWIDCVMLRHR